MKASMPEALMNVRRLACGLRGEGAGGVALAVSSVLVLWLEAVCWRRPLASGRDYYDTLGLVAGGSCGWRWCA